MAAYIQKTVIEHDDLFLQIMKFLSVTDLIEKKVVCHHWKNLCTKSIDYKCLTYGRKKFRSNKELKNSIRKYLRCNASDAEAFAKIYGWPIGKWDVSRIEDFAGIFFLQGTFNEDISQWDTSRGTNMAYMFSYAESFNQDISTWDTSRVKSMAYMFNSSRSFNQNISTWNTCNVRNMEFMFYDARVFSYDISTWNFNRVENMSRMFQYAHSFNHSLSVLDTSKVGDKKYLTSDAKLPSRNKFKTNTSKSYRAANKCNNRIPRSQNILVSHSSKSAAKIKNAYAVDLPVITKLRSTKR
mmetsp:Transcript_20184/g.22547  ORF Transcript_20184/g.22547 Transcript_20184/m.22547 type:complete len:297 (-) Transcript_20184:97-987(-)